MKTPAAVTWASEPPITLESLDLAAPRAGEVLDEIKATGRTGWFELSRVTPEGFFLAVEELRDKW